MLRGKLDVDLTRNHKFEWVIHEKRDFLKVMHTIGVQNSRLEAHDTF